MPWTTRDLGRRHRPRVAQADRRALERAGWRTLLDYREDLVRDDQGMLLGVVATWVAEAERNDATGAVLVTMAARRPDLIWADLRAAVAAS
jgi:hypothetical protein